MRALRIFAIAVAVAILIPSYVHAEDLGAVRTTLIEKSVYVYTEDQDEWFEATANFPLREGDAIWVAEDGRAEINIRGGTYVRLDYETLLEILQVGRFLESDDNDVRLFLEEGALYINNERTGYDNIRIESNYSSVRVPEGAVAMVDVYENGSSRISVLKGHVYSQSSAGGLRVEAGSSVVLGEELYALIAPLGEPTAWERWNKERDRNQRRVYASTRYLPDELHDYAYDFDEHGSWVYVREYGHVWRPSLSISVSLGWSPYRHGHWRWRHGHYVWISYERWGWAPYHYGRWAHIRGMGWCWVPPRHGAVHWGPGYVGWVYTSGYVSWVPLAPREIYYGYGHYGPYSVNIIDIDIHKTVIKNVYVNSKVKNAVTIIHRDTFLTGKKRSFRKPDNPFKHGKPGLGPPPDFRPDKKGKPVKRDKDFYKKTRAERRAEEKQRPERRHRPEARPEPPRKIKEKKEREPSARPERQGPEMKFQVPSRRERPERPGRGVESEKQAPGRELQVPERETPRRSRERVITPPRPREKSESRGRRDERPESDAPARVITPRSTGEKNGHDRVITPSGESRRDRWERPSPPGRNGESSGRSITPKRPSAPESDVTPLKRVGPPASPAQPGVKGNGDKGGEKKPAATKSGDKGKSKEKSKEKSKKKGDQSEEEQEEDDESDDDDSGSSNGMGRGRR